MMEGKNIKLLYILGDTEMDGSKISFKIILDSVLALGCEVIVLVSKSNTDDYFRNYLTKNGCIVESFDAEWSTYPICDVFSWKNSFLKFPKKMLRKIYRLVKSNKQVLDIIKSHKPDVVHTNVGVFHQGYRACNQLGIPHLWHLREYQTKDFKLAIMPSMRSFKRQLRKCNVVTITNDILEYFELNNVKSATAIWNGILPADSAVYVHEKKPYFLCANRISPEKRLDVAIKAFASVADKLPNYRLLIVGKCIDKAYTEELTELASSFSCSSRIEFHDFRPDVINLMKDATALMVTSNFEGLGRMSVEASFMGCLVLGRNTGGTKEILNFTGGGYLFNTQEELIQQMVEVASIAGTEGYKKKVLAAQRIAIDSFSNEQYCQRIFNIYKDLIFNFKKASI